MEYKISKLEKKIPGSCLDSIVALHRLCFPDDATDDDGRRKIITLWNNPPVMQYWIAKENETVIGYIRWVKHGGIRKNAVIELEQIGIHPLYQGKGVATSLIDQSLEELAFELKQGSREIKLVYVSTGDNNFAQKLYAKTLGAKVSAKIPSFYEDSAMNVNEVIMIARKDDIKAAREKRGLECLYL